MDLVYSQSGTLYDFIPNVPRPSTNPSKPPVETPIDGVVGSMQPPYIMKLVKKQIYSLDTSLSPIIFTQVNTIQSSQTPSNKKKGKGKFRKSGNQ